jgi:hypothetical protein
MNDQCAKPNAMSIEELTVSNMWSAPPAPRNGSGSGPRPAKRSSYNYISYNSRSSYES